ncbi:hypothetical protein [Clostridium grantii]|uniref:Uncharacterized membrane protein YczE n=1 Tax=Clostridium grantii DSM 8605 TaxID=1121316 RepID=A0A1M5TF93_9CLOT|nr:hypothetical protein [Clostridium grantii]SHH49485.1 Uncharacterized membrane protein YczE [Clostridium grantii DSM 8605]
MIKWIVYCLGYIFWGIGASVILNTHIGAGAWDALFSNLSMVFGMSIGTWMIIITSIITLVSSYLLKKIYYQPVIIGFFMGFILNAFNYIFSPLLVDANIYINILSFGIGLYIMSFGVAVQIYTKGILPPVDFFVITLKDTQNLNYIFTKIVTEIGAIAVALVVGYLGGIGTGQINAGTIAIAIVIAPLINFNQKIVTRMLGGVGTFGTKAPLIEEKKLVI